MHIPVNHPLRPLYRALGALTGGYLALFGIVGIIANAGDDFFAVHPGLVLGQGANMFGSIILLALGAVVVLSTIMGNNRDSSTYRFLGWTALVLGMYAITTSRTDANIVGFTISTVIVTFVAGLFLITAGLYVQIAPDEETGAPRQVREAVLHEAQSA